ncbi:Glycosylphosphatidylinositol anchor attachment 1 protein [Ananas comosus]|uniref:Glycosylphosphatidylinositol anchor attachment 1 protein n=1 Tax=Ananas comosus TaxID=4615 RepID=A0A199UF20_ANACO|nr:Glycosylphosphatidylinositol anchor attachment 1 protein [Ananas comosus]
MAGERGEEGDPNLKKRAHAARSRLIVRLGAFLVSHSALVSVVCCVAGFITLFLLPVLAKHTYISENALMPGSANPLFSSQDVNEANRFIKGIIHKRIEKEEAGIELQKFIGQSIADVGAEVYYHKFSPHTNHFNPLHFFSSTSNTARINTNNSCASFGVNTVGIIRAPRGDGKEAIVLVSPYNSQNMEYNEALSLGLAFSVFSLLSKVTWLAKDIVWLAADSRFGEYNSVSSWLNDYHNPIFSRDSGNLDSISNDCHHWNEIRIQGANSNFFKRAGTMAAALVFKVMEKKEKGDRDCLTMYAEASNGQMPNLDLLNIVHYLAVHRQGLRVKIETMGSLLNSAWVKFTGEILEGVSRLSKSLNPQWKFDVTTADYVEGAATLASSMYYQALGVPTGSHGAFRDYQIDAVTLEFLPRFYLRNENVQSTFLLRSGRLIEGVVRSVNNLLEKFHQSFFLYFLTAPNKFVSVGVYMIAFALLVAPLPIVAAALFARAKANEITADDSAEKCTPIDTKESEIATGSWKWLQAAKVLLMIHSWAAIVSLLPYYISHMPNLNSTMSMLTWVSLSISTLPFLYALFGSPFSLNVEWELLKAVMVATISISLGLMSIINFSTAQIGTMLLVPMSLLVHPLKAKMNVNALLRAALLTCNIAFAFLGFPPVALLVAKGLSEGFGKLSIGDFWEWMEFLWEWNSATCLYLLWVQLPCWLLCIHILLHPCSRGDSRHKQ